MAPIKSAALGALALAISLSAALGAEVAVDWKLGMGSTATIAAQAGDVLKFTWGGTHDVKVMPDAASITESCDFSGAVTTGVANPTSSPATYTIASGAKHCDKLIFACSKGTHCKNEQHLTVTIGDTAGDTSTCSSAGRVGAWVMGAASAALACSVLLMQ